MEAGRYLDRLVAEKVVGWAVKDGTAYSPDGGAWDASREWLPYYSTDISDAWQVVEKLESKGLRMILERWTLGWRCYYIYPQTETVQEDTAPLAICLAALKAAGVKVAQ